MRPLNRLFPLVVVVGSAIVGACQYDRPTAPGIRASLDVVSHKWTIKSYVLDSGAADPIIWKAACGSAAVGSCASTVPVPARFRASCSGGSYGAWQINTTGIYTKTCLAVEPSDYVEFQIELNDSLNTTSAGTGRIVVDTSAGTNARTRVVKDIILDLSWADGPVYNVIWPQWFGYPYALLYTVARRAENIFTYKRTLNGPLAIHVCHQGTGLPVCPRINTWLAPPSPYTGNDTLHLDPSTIYPWSALVWTYGEALGTIAHEYGHAYLGMALHSNPSGFHDAPGTGLIDLNETFAEFFAMYVGGYQRYGGIWGGGTPTPADPAGTFDDWDLERDTLRADTAHWGGFQKPEFYDATFLLDMVDVASDSNAYLNTTGDGAGVDDESINWGPKYLADVLFGNAWNSPGSHCTVTWTGSFPGGFHGEADDFQDLLVCLEHVGTQQSDVIPHWQYAFRPSSQFVSFTTTVTNPTGWSQTKIRTLWKYDLFNVGSLP